MGACKFPKILPFEYVQFDLHLDQSLSSMNTVTELSRQPLIAWSRASSQTGVLRSSYNLIYSLKDRTVGNSVQSCNPTTNAMNSRRDKPKTKIIRILRPMRQRKDACSRLITTETVLENELSSVRNFGFRSQKIPSSSLFKNGILANTLGCFGKKNVQSGKKTATALSRTPLTLWRRVVFQKNGLTNRYIFDRSM